MWLYFYILIHCGISLSFADPNVYQWSRVTPVGYISSDRQLIIQSTLVTIFKEDGFQMEAVCAKKCRCTLGCRAYNWFSSKKVCELLQRTHTDTTGGVDSAAPKLQLVNGSVYRLLNDYTITKESLWQCQPEATPPEVKNGVCSSGIGTCVCESGWGGANCDQIMDSQLLLSQWSQWSACTRTCLSGIQTRSRNCSSRSGISTSASILNCNTALIENRQCAGLLPCPQWSSWTPYSICSSNQTCGVGKNFRSRVCTNNGTAGRDRYCLGDMSFTKSCYGTSCDDPLSLTGGTQSFGSGIIRIADGFICSDADFNVNACNVVCRQLGLSRCFTVKQGDPSTLPEVIAQSVAATNLKFLLSNVKCNGSESTVQLCSHNTWGNVSACVSKKPVNIDCVVNGQWSYWMDWSPCSVSCILNGKQGQQTRTRSCTFPVPRNGGLSCVGSSSESKSCVNLVQCPIDGQWTLWQGWSNCDVSCGNGSQFRTRECSTPLYGGLNCTGNKVDTKSCDNLPNCPVNGMWTEWSAWLECTLTCGSGQQNRTRSCSAPSPQYGGLPCNGNNYSTRKCNENPCPIKGGWSFWNEWTTCNVTCGGGSQQRFRSCSNPAPQYGGDMCSGDSSETTDCNTQNCPIDGYWTTWTMWSLCTVSCGGGSQYRNRTCIHDPNGKDCEGNSFEVVTCNDMFCPIDGYWLEWSEWSACSQTCDGGNQNRSRICVPPQYGGNNCAGADTQTNICNDFNCPVNGVWEPWSDWSMCSFTCGGGEKTRARSCIDPKYGGEPCSGNYNETISCNEDPCPIDGYWNDWSDWTICSNSCGGGVQHRSRECVPPQYGGLDCDGFPNEQNVCNDDVPCPVDGYWKSWSPWSACSKTCDFGSQNRTRMCEPAKYGGLDCTGLNMQSQACILIYCPINGIWQPWSDWSTCSVTCGGGQQIRARSCIDPKYDGKPCSGNYNETKSCNEDACPIWSNWFSWEGCSRTCGVGQRRRTRNCNTITGVTVASELCTWAKNWANQSEPCNTFSCSPALSCTEWRQRGVNTSDYLWVDPDGIDNGEAAILLYCDMTAQNGIGVSIANHNLTNKTLVSGFDISETKIFNLTYNNSSHAQIHNLALISRKCRQYIQFNCVQLPFTTYYPSQFSSKNYIIKTMNYWTSYNINLKQNIQSNYYWGDAPQPPVPNVAPEKMVCSCGANGMPCSYRDETFQSNIPLYCKCDNIQYTDPSATFTDEGYLNYKEDLPVMQLRFGVKQESTNKAKTYGYITVGQLECWGTGP